jgi:hypothetical protein
MARPNDPRYPIYIPSKGRWESRLTVRALEAMGVPYRLVIEPQEFDRYAAVIDPARILTLPWFRPGSHTELVAARNWIWGHAQGQGAARHWQIDDNIQTFYRFQRNQNYRLKTGVGFRALEDFVDRYANVALAGMQYEMFVPRKDKYRLPFTLNTRIYSCTLIQNDIPYRYRGIYNDDTDLSLRVLKDGWCTILSLAFLIKKVATMRLRGGNTPIYRGAGRLEMARSLQRQHPDVVRLARRWGRWQHMVDYRPFRHNRLIRRPGVLIPEGVDEYGMELIPAPGE